MIYLLWSVLNIGIFLLFILICFKATKLVREKLGLLATLLFVCGLLSFVTNSETGNNEQDSNQIKTWKFTTEDTPSNNESYRLTIDLEKTMISNYSLGIRYAKDKQEEIFIPISAYSTTTGFTSGTNWKPTSILVNRASNNQAFHYSVSGIVEWKLLGTTLYSQPKEYEGMVSIK